MPGPTPISASHRLTFLYTVNSFQHKNQNYCDAVASADPTGWSLRTRDGITLEGISNIQTAFFIRIAPFYDPADTSFDGWLLEVYFGGAYYFVAAGATTTVPTGGGLSNAAMGWDTTGKSSSQKTMHNYLYEGNFRFPNKVSGYTALNAAEKAVIDWSFDTQATGNAALAYAWRMSRGATFAVRWLAAVWDTNEKLRRLRGIK